jgi:hydroxymethylglutaryl-CoA lyase
MPQPGVIVREVGPRDGLQNVSAFFPTDQKCAWIDAEFAAGVRHMQVTSFVPASVIPQFTDAEAVVAHALALDGLDAGVLIPNAKGAARALDAGARHLGFVLSASESHNLRNVRRTVQQSLDEFRAVVELRRSDERGRGVKLSGGVSTAFGCTIEGPIDEDKVIRLAETYLKLGADELNIADTVGYANPAQVKRLFRRVLDLADGAAVTAHFHDTRGLGLANVAAALDAGIRVFDASLAGLGGCPFAPGATGNIATEDLVYMLESMGLSTGIDLEKLIAVRRVIAETLPGEPLHGAVAKAGPHKGFTNATPETALEAQL